MMRTMGIVKQFDNIKVAKDMNNRHAYCIIAHNEPLVLKKLIELIDDKRNDIYLLVDSKTNIGIYKDIKARNAWLFYAPRIDVRWGTVKQIEAELILFEMAFKNGPYQYYHLLSGVDLPLKTQDYIHDFMDKNQGKEFVGFVHGKHHEEGMHKKTEVYHLFLKYYKSNNAVVRKISHILHYLFVRIQYLLGIKRKYDMELQKGANWCSITNEFCHYLLQRKGYILKTFRYTLCGDEIFLHSILFDSPFKDKIYNWEDEFASCMREIDWTRGFPYVWKVCDYDFLVKSDKLFARKFSSEDMEIVDKIYSYVKSNECGK